MPRIHPLSENEIPASVQVALQRYAAAVTWQPIISNTKATLAYSVAAFEVYTKLEPLFEELQKVLGIRQAALYAYHISVTNGCKICTAYFKKVLTDNDVRPEGSNSLSEKEKELVNFGNAVAKYHGHIADHVYNQLALYYTKEEMVVLIAFAGQLIAVTVFNNTAEIELDEHLAPYALK